MINPLSTRLFTLRVMAAFLPALALAISLSSKR
ncbi:Uncharacterised protein [Vibrio cholerae]|nr:Uncharacterised protein [Vibrio cholerae]